MPKSEGPVPAGFVASCGVGEKPTRRTFCRMPGDHPRRSLLEFKSSSGSSFLSIRMPRGKRPVRAAGSRLPCRAICKALQWLDQSRKKQVTHATEQERPDVQAKCRAWKRQESRLNAKQLAFVDEAGISTQMRQAGATLICNRKVIDADRKQAGIMRRKNNWRGCTFFVFRDRFFHGHFCRLFPGWQELVLGRRFGSRFLGGLAR